MLKVKLNSGFQVTEANLLHEWSDALAAATEVSKTVLRVHDSPEGHRLITEYLDMRHAEIRNAGLPTQAICSIKRNYAYARTTQNS